jgi:4-amino-4-deoxy-L-arabinose transferase-like glycosyltransferase
MIFNPNSFAAAQGTQPETVFTFLLVSALYLFFAFVRSKRFWLLPAIGLLVAVATYCRPVGLYLGLMIPAGVALYATIGCVSFQQRAR